MSKTVTVTGAAGAIGYAILFRAASGQLLGPDEKLRLKLLEIEPALKAAEGTAMELDDCAFPLLESIDITSDPNEAFDGANIGLLVGARPRSKGMERADLLEANGAIFQPQGQAINARAADDVRILVVGNPANTNALIAQRNAPDVPAERFTAMTRLDQNRAVVHAGQEARRRRRRRPGPRHLGQPLADDVPRPLQRHGERAAAPSTRSTRAWYADEYIPKVGKRGAAIIEARGASSAASAANAAIDHVRDWVLGADGLRSMAVRSDGSYGVEEGLISSFPVRVSGGSYEIAQGLDVGDFARERIDRTVQELKEERDAVQQLGLLGLVASVAPRDRCRSSPAGARAGALCPFARATAASTIRQPDRRPDRGRLRRLRGVPAPAVLADQAVLLERRGARGRGSSA